MPVLLNEVFVRGFYFIRHLAEDLKNKNDFKKVEWNKVIPFKNRTVARMLTIATGTFTAVDMADAAIRTAKDGAAVSVPTFFASMVLRVNFVGVGRFAIAIGTDVGMGVKKGHLENQRMQIMGEQLALYGAKVSYKQASMWIAAENAGVAIEQSYLLMERSVAYYVESFAEIEKDLQSIGYDIERLRKEDPEFVIELLRKFSQDKSMYYALRRRFGPSDISPEETRARIEQLRKKREGKSNG